MTIEEAILTALEFENEVRDIYKTAMAEAADPTGQRVFKALANEEQSHVDYLQSRLDEWRRTGRLDAGSLETTLPSREAVAEAARNVSGGMTAVDRGAERELLGKALVAERKTSGFYKDMVAKLPPEGRKLFEPFVEIEEGHVAIVQAELDSLTNTGAWFDFVEVKL